MTYEILRGTYPDVLSALKTVPPDDSDGWHSLNYLVPLLSSPAFAYIVVCGEQIRFKGTVWHFANWNALKGAMIKKFGARRVNWVSVEHVDPYDWIEF